MKRKIFSKLLMGALLVASVSSFTSCKDYDDDINGLKDDVAKRALLSDVTALQTTVSGVKSTAEQALEKANAAATATDLNGVKTDLATVKGIAEKAATDAAKGIKDAATAQEAAEAADKAAKEAKAALADYAKTSDLAGYVKNSELETTLAEYVKASALATAVADAKQQIETFVATSKGDFDKLKADVEKFKETYSAIWNAVTSVSLYATISDGPNGPAAFVPNDPTGTAGDDFVVTLTYGRVNKNHLRNTTVKLNGTNVATDNAAAAVAQTDATQGTFGKKDYYGVNGAYNAAASTSVTFNHGDYVRPAESIIVRVSPTNAVLNASDVKFMDSNGNDLSSVIEVKAVYPYTGTLTRAASTSGLWTIDFSLADKTMPADLMAKTQTTWGSDKVFAVAVNNTADAAADRYAVSEYELSFDTGIYDGFYSLDGARITTNPNDWAAGNTMALKDVKGRDVYNAAGLPQKGYSDYEYTTYNNIDPVTVASATANNVNLVNKPATSRAALVAYPVNNGQEFTVIATDGTAGTIAGKAGGTWRDAKYVYVIRDDMNGNQDNDASEINAWNTYSFKGLNTLVEGNSVTLSVTIPSTSILGDEVCFRLFAVNEDGTLVDPDGYPFSVFVGNEVKTANVTSSFTATKALGLTKVFDVTGTISSGAAFAAVVATPVNFSVNNVVVNTAATVTWKQANGTTNATSWANAKKVEVQFSNTVGQEMSVWPDGATGYFSLDLTSGTPATKDFTINFALTKNLPTAADVAGLWSWKAEQLKAGVWKAVMYPENATFAANASTAAIWQNEMVAVNTWGAYHGMNNAINGLVDNTGVNYIDETHATITTWRDAQVDGTFVFTFEKSASNANNRTYAETATVDMTLPAAPVVTGTYSNGYILQMHQNNVGYTRLADLIDNTTQHASAIYYDFGLVSSNVDPADITAPLDGYAAAAAGNYIVKLQDFQTVYACPFDQLNVKINPFTLGKKKNADGSAVIDAGDQVWNYVYYNDPQFANGDIYSATSTIAGNVMTNISATTAANLITFTSQIGADFVVGNLTNLVNHCVLNDAAGTGVKAKFISNSTGNEDYFTATLTAAGGLVLNQVVSGITDPGVDIPSTLVLTCRCAFGHDHEIKIPFTVKTRAVAP